MTANPSPLSDPLSSSLIGEPVPGAYRALEVGGHTLRYRDEGPTTGADGPGETLLCVHGNPTWSFYYRRLFDRFADRYRVIAVDHIGCGLSDKPRRGSDRSRGQFPYTLAAHRDNLLALVDALKLDHITLVAHDWGGAIGLATMLRRLDRVARIVLLNTAAFPPPYVPWRIAACRLPVVGTAAVRGLNAFARAAVTMAMSRNRLDPAVARTLLSPYGSWTQRVAIDAFVRDIPLTKHHPTYRTLQDLEASLPNLAQLPSLLVWGMQDWCFRPECLRRFQEVWPRAEAVEIADAGHYVLEDAPQETIEAIERFVASTP